MELSNAPALVFKEPKKAHAKAKTSLLLQKPASFHKVDLSTRIFVLG